MKLDELKQAALAATPGPWAVSDVKGDVGTIWQHGSGGAIAWPNFENETGHHHPFEDATFIAKANPTAILELVERVEGLEAALRRYGWLASALAQLEQAASREAALVGALRKCAYTLWEDWDEPGEMASRAEVDALLSEPETS
jgi:uncharacterized protein CbrC (UPF0167 family)